MPDGMKHSRTEPLLRDSDTPQSGSASGGHAVRKAPPTPDNHAQLEKAVSDRFTDPQDFELFMLAIEGPQDGVWDWNIERDTGVGVAPENVEVVLSPFGQIDSAHAPDHQGTGLGLPLVHAFIEMHDGRLAIQIELGEGTTVSLYFPPERTRK